MTKWSELKEDFVRTVFRDGVQKTADRIPIHRRTAYRLVNGETTQPSIAVKAGVERMLREDSNQES